MKKRIFSLLLTLVMILGMLPAMAQTANAAGNYIRFGIIKIPAGSYLEQGSYTPTTTKPADNYAYYDGTTLELHNYTDAWLVVTEGSDLLIRLYGYNYMHGVDCNDVNTTMASLCIEGNGTLSIDGCIEAKDLSVNSGNLEIAASSGAVFVDTEKVTYPKNSIALCSKNVAEAWEPFDFDKVIDKNYRRVMIISGVSFGPQSPAMPEGKTEHDLGTVAALNYPISFQGAWTDSFTSAGYTQYETLTVYNSKSQMVYGKSQACNSVGLTYDLKDLPADRYVIKEMLTVRDANDKVIFNKTHTFTIDGTPAVVPYVIAKSTEPIAGTVNTAPTITIAPECHCKVSDYAEGYWLYYTKGLGWRRMEENTKFEVGKDYAYYFAIETTDGYTFPADGGNVNGILQCDQGYFGASVNRVDGRDDVAEMMLSYQPCTYGAPLEFIDQTPVFVESSYANTCEVEGFPGETITFSFNHQPLTAAQKAQGFEVRRTFLVYQGLTNALHTVQKDTGTQPLSFSFTIDQTQTYLVAESIELVKNGTVLQTKSIMYKVKVVSNGTPVIFTADSSNTFGGTVTVDINAMAAKDANLKTALQNGTVKYQWYRGYTQIPGATGQSYTFHADDVGKDIRVTVVYGDNGSISEPFTVKGTAPAFTKQPPNGYALPGGTANVTWTTNFSPVKIVVDSYNFVGLPSVYQTLDGSAASVSLPVNEYGYVIKAYYNDKDFISSQKFTVEVPTELTVTRISGKGRCETAIKAADELKEVRGVSKFDSIIIASGMNFADALAGSYLAARKSAPILLYQNGRLNLDVNYVTENLAVNGTVYILGGTAAVPAEVEEALVKAGVQVSRLSGKNRYLTNIAILEEAGVSSTRTILVATGTNFADSLSASATGLPILLVNGTGSGLNSAQKSFLDDLSSGGTLNLMILGGTGAVNDTIANELRSYGNVERLSGKTRYDTSVAVAERFFNNPDAVLVAYGKNFPDGLSGGPLAYAMGAPLLLTQPGKESTAAAYVAEQTLAKAYVLGGTAAVSDETVDKIFK